MEAGRKVGREGQEGGLSLLSLRTRRPSAGAADMGGLWLAQGPSSPLALLDRWGRNPWSSTSSWQSGMPTLADSMPSSSSSRPAWVCARFGRGLR
jgi:hypothetical protein